MELTLKRLLEHAEFKKYRGKGYDPTEVDDFLDRAAAMAGKVEVQLTQALEQAKSAGGGAGTGPDPDEVEAEIERRVAERVAASPSGPSQDETAAQAQRTLAIAQRTADAVVSEAREDAEKLLSASKEQSETILADTEARAAAINAACDEREAASKELVEAEAAHERRDARQRLAAEIGELEGVRERLRSDANVLERHVEEQRSQLGSTLAELQQILDDPSGFRMAPAPALADPVLPDFADLAEPEAEPEASADAAAEPEGEAEPEATSEPDGDADAEADGELEPEAELDPEADLEVDGEPEVEPDAEADSGSVAELPAPPQLLTFDEVDHESPGLEDPPDSGPPTAPVSAVDLGIEEPPAHEDAPPEEAVDEGDDEPAPDEDAFLTELRKAMADEEPLGPRDHDEVPHSGELFEDDDRRGWRFGRRR